MLLESKAEIVVLLKALMKDLPKAGVALLGLYVKNRVTYVDCWLYNKLCNLARIFA